MLPVFLAAMLLKERCWREGEALSRREAMKEEDAGRRGEQAKLAAL